METYNISIIIIFILCSAIFAGLEVAFLASDKLMIELEKEKSNNIIKNKVLSFLLEKPSHILGTTLICLTVSIVVSSSYMSDMLHEILAPKLPSYLKNDVFLMILETFIITIITLLFAEFIPKSIVILNPNRFLYIFSIPLAIATILLYPLVSVLTYISNFILKYIFKQSYIETKPEFELKDFHSFLHKTIDITKKKNPTIMRAKMASNVIDFKKVRMRDCMVPRTEITAIEKKEGIQGLKKIFADSEHSKILIYKNDIDNIIGYCRLKDLLKKQKEISEILNPIIIIPETSFATEVLVKFIEENQSIALVVDEFGGTAGIVTLEDIIEEIFGEIQDEHDTEVLTEKKISNDTYLISARNEINYLNEKYNWNLPKGEYETIGGYITQIVEKIPHKNELIETENFKFIIIAKKSSYIETIKVIIKESKDE